MNWQQLRYFEVLAREEHYTKAAEQLYITQPALSKAISNLEDDIGIPLFEQQGRQVKLTRYGRIFFNYVRNATRELDNGLEVLHNMINRAVGTVSIGSIFTVMSEVLPNMVKNFLDVYPDIKFLTRQQSTVETLKYLKEDLIDLAFVAEYDEDSESYKDLDRSLISIENINIAVPRNHPLAEKKEIKFSEVQSETFIYYNENTGITRSIRKALEDSGYDVNNLNISFLASEDNSILGLVRAGLGIAFITEAANVNPVGVSMLKVSDIYLYRNVYMAWKRNRYMSPAVRIFRNYVLNAASKGPFERHNQQPGDENEK